MSSPPELAAQMPTFVEIMDPVAGYRYTLDPLKKIAHRVAIAPRPNLPAPPRPTPATSGAAGKTGVVFGSKTPAMDKYERESLGTKIMEGVLVEGHRTITTIPAGEAGNDRPISNVTEVWFSPELRENIEWSSSDSRTGRATTRLTKIDRNNPDPMLFLVPPDYEIVDEQGSFSINYSR
jgi:hypothetical protein